MDRATAEAYWLWIQADRRLNPGRSKSGSYNINTPDESHTYNFRSFIEGAEQRPNPARMFGEAEILDGLRGMQGRVPVAVYVDPEGRFIVQPWVDATPLDKLFTPDTVNAVPLGYFRGAARFWSDVMQVEVEPGGLLSQPTPYPRRVTRFYAVHDPQHGHEVRRPPRDPAEHMELQLRDVKAQLDWNTVRSDFLSAKFGIPGDADQYARRHLERVETPSELVLGLPDQSLENQAVLKPGTWDEPFFYDLELLTLLDPRQVPANLVTWSPFNADKSREIVGAFRDHAPEHLKRTFHHDVAAWAKVSAIHRAIRLLHSWDGNPARSVGSAYAIMNRARRAWGAPPLTKAHVRDVLHDAAALKGAGATLAPAARTAMQGFGVHASPAFQRDPTVTLRTRTTSPKRKNEQERACRERTGRL